MNNYFKLGLYEEFELCVLLSGQTHNTKETKQFDWQNYRDQNCAFHEKTKHTM